MTDITAAADMIWGGIHTGNWFPEALQGKLELDAALRVQLDILGRKVAGGATQGGWKIGLTSERVRARYGTEARPFGHLMAGDMYATGAEVSLARFPHAAIEPELCLVIGQTLQGGGITPQQARAAVRGLCPGYELNQDRARGVKDFPLAVADNLSQWGIVTGEEVPLDDAFDPAGLRVTLARDGEQVSEAIGRDVIDDHFLSLSILANTLAEYGLRLEAGMRVITGSFSKHEVAAGQSWEAEFHGIGKVRVSFKD